MQAVSACGKLWTTKGNDFAALPEKKDTGFRNNDV
jgi:hypothetical protein